MGDRTRTYDNSDVVSVSGRIMVIVVIVLFLIVVFILFLHLYAKWNWQRRAHSTLPSRSRRRRGRFVFAPSQDPILVMHRGLEPSVIRSLPVMIFHPEEFKDGLECAVCLCELSDGEKGRLLPKCNHGFHVECIDMWFQSHSTCPLCRNPVVPESFISSPESSEIGSPDDYSVAGYSIQSSPTFPTNVLFWGNQIQVSTGEGPSSSSPHLPASSTRPAEGTLMIEIPRRLTESSFSSSPLSPLSASRFMTEEEESKSPQMTGRLRTLKRLLSREKRVIIPCTPPPLSSVVDIEQGEGGGRGQCSQAQPSFET